MSPRPVSPASLSPADPVRELLRRFALRWAGEHAGTGSAEEGTPPELVFVDPFAGRDYPGRSGGGSLAAEVADRLLRGRGTPGAWALLMEEDPAKVEWLGRALSDRAVDGASGLTLLEDAAGAMGDLAGAANEARSSLLLLDPPSAASLPLECLRPWLALRSAELLVRFPAADLRRLARHWTGTLADLPPYPRRVADGLSRLLGDARRSWVFQWRATLEERGEAAAETEVVRLLAARLSGGPGVVVRHLVVEGGEGAPDHLLHRVQDPLRALSLNDLVLELRRDGSLPWPESELPLVRYPRVAALQLFGDGGADARERVVDRVRLAHDLAERFSGRTVSLGDIASTLLETELVADDVRRALSELRRDGRALFRSLATADAEIAFPRLGSRARGVRVPRRGRRGGAEELDLPLDGE